MLYGGFNITFILTKTNPLQDRHAVIESYAASPANMEPASEPAAAAPCPFAHAPASHQPGESPLRARPREKRPERWKRVVRKNRRIAGQEYVNTKGELVKPKEMGGACSCRMKCYNKVDEPTRQNIFTGFYALRSYDEQNAYLFGLIRKTEIRRQNAATSERRTCNYQYFVRSKGREIQICKQAFANIHAITFKKIRMLSQKLDQNIMFPRDQRGKHANRKKISEQTKEQVRKHISDILRSPDLRSFLKEDKVLGMDLNLTKMHKDYLKRFEPMAFEAPSAPDKLREGHQPEVKIWLYSSIYHSDFRFTNLSALRVSQQKAGGRESAAGAAAAAEGTGVTDRKKTSAPRRSGRARKKQRLSAGPAVSAAPPPAPAAALSNPAAPAPAADPTPVVIHHVMPEQSAPPDLMNLAVEQLVFQTAAPRPPAPPESAPAPLQLCLPLSCVQPLNLQAQPLDLHHPHAVFSVQTGPGGGGGDTSGGGAQSQFGAAPQEAAAGASTVAVQDYGGTEVHLVPSAAGGAVSGGGGAGLYDWQLPAE